MHLDQARKQIRFVIFATLVVILGCPLSAQVVPPIERSGLPIALGGGYASWDVDWAHGRMGGFALWADVHPPHLPHFLDGLDIEIEGRDVNMGQNMRPAGFRQITAGGGFVYHWRHFRNFQPYAKGLKSFGRIDFGECLAQCGTPHPYTYDTRAVYSPGGGFEYRAYRNVWFRSDYEYQFWPNLTGNTYLNPQGFTFGAMYDFAHRRPR